MLVKSKTLDRPPSKENWDVQSKSSNNYKMWFMQSVHTSMRVKSWFLISKIQRLLAFILG